MAGFDDARWSGEARAAIEALARSAGVGSNDIDALLGLVDRAVRDAVGPSLGSLPTLVDFAPVQLIPAHSDSTESGVSVDHADRYEDLGLLGTGSMGEVRRVRDTDLNRTLAMKTVLPGVLLQPRVVARFVEEAQATAQLQHPNIVPVHDIGTFDDGRVWFTMREVEGRTLAAVIREVHQEGLAQREATASGWSFRRLVAAFLQVCNAVAYAHERGVVHRDLKPENVLVGAHGEVYVVDWGLAKIVGRPDTVVDPADWQGVVTDRAVSGSHPTRVGTVSGTPVYMSPEQARGDIDEVDVRSDVYGLGVMLYEVLSGRVPIHEDDVVLVLARVAAGALDPLPDDPRIPEELQRICFRAMSSERGQRHPTAAALADEVQAWLDGAQRREQARGMVNQALGRQDAIDALRQRAAALRDEADQHLRAIPRWAPSTEKAPGWALEDAAAALSEEADQLDLALERGLHAALRIDPLLPEAHGALIRRALERHRAAEAIRDGQGARRAQGVVEHHAEQLVEGHALRGEVAAYLKGTGSLTLHVDADGATVELFRFEERNRRLVPVPHRDLGAAPVVDLALEMGSWLCVLRHPDRETVRYPVFIGRGEAWRGIPPGQTEARPIHLPLRGSLGPDDVYVPAGWFRSGGDPVSTDSLPSRRLWCDGFVIRRHPTVNGEFVEFLNDLVEQGREVDALRWAPRAPSASPDEPGHVLYGRDDSGRFELTVDAEGDEWFADAPVLMVHFGCAAAYARWKASTTGQPWRLPSELEWEKAARGVDGRWYPWGDFLDPSWACYRDSHARRPIPQRITAFPDDVSVYGVQGLAGNVRDWCADRWHRDGPPVPDQRVQPVHLPEGVDLGPNNRRALRGGNWAGQGVQARCCNRHGHEPTQGIPSIGFRVVRSLTSDDP